MFDSLITESKMVAIGLYREKTKGNSKYVYIKPDADAKLFIKDKVFVLCMKQPKNGNPFFPLLLTNFIIYCQKLLILTILGLV